MDGQTIRKLLGHIDALDLAARGSADRDTPHPEAVKARAMLVEAFHSPYVDGLTCPRCGYLAGYAITADADRGEAHCERNALQVSRMPRGLADADELACPWIGEVMRTNDGAVRILSEAEERPGMVDRRAEEARNLGLALYERRQSLARARAEREQRTTKDARAGREVAGAARESDSTRQ